MNHGRKSFSYLSLAKYQQKSIFHVYMKHIPVLKNEVLRYLDLSNRGLIIDATLGLGGHSEAILESKEFKGKILGIDQDQSHLDFAKEGLKKYGDRFTAVKANF